MLIHDAFRHMEWEWLLHRFESTNVFMDTHLYHAFNINDLASDNPDCDKSKQVVSSPLASKPQPWGGPRLAPPLCGVPCLYLVI
eukprot:SAG22_NODE_1395_length_4511_cov_3.492747_2_plen_84_part_00